MKFQDYLGLKTGVKLISPEIGVIKQITQLTQQHSDPKIYNYNCWTGDTRSLGGGKCARNIFGYGFKREDAILSVLCNAVENYCTAFVIREDFIKMPYKNFSGKVIKPNEIALFHPKQFINKNFPFVPFTHEKELNWTKCVDLINGGEIYYPASMVYDCCIEADNHIGFSSSSGLAAHPDYYQAILNGLFKALENDSYMIVWMQKLIVPKIEIDQDIQEYLNKYGLGHYEFHFFDITLDIDIPIILGMMFGKTEYGHFVSVCSAARSTYREAIQQVVLKMSKNVAGFRHILSYRKDWSPKDFNEICTTEDHTIFYMKRPDLCRVFDTWKNISPSVKIDFNPKKEHSVQFEIKRILELLKKNGYNVLLKDITMSDMRELGYHCVNIIIPQLIQAPHLYKAYYLGGKRLYQVPEILGYEVNEFENLNKYPISLS